MAKVNRYGRQIFLSRAEIVALRDLVEREIVNVRDSAIDMEHAIENSIDPESIKAYQADLKDLQADLKVYQGLIGTESSSSNGKLWYYVEPKEVKL